MTTLVIERRSKLRQGRRTGKSFYGVFRDDGTGAIPTGKGGFKWWCLCGKEHRTEAAAAECLVRLGGAR